MIPYFFAENEVSEIWLTFPDPQMKKVNKRLTSTNFMQLYSKFLKPDGKIHLKTDSRFLFTYTKAMVQKNSFPILEINDDIYGNDFNPPELGIKTYYENQWLERNIPIKYICFQPIAKIGLIEPNIEIEPDEYRSFKRERRV
jgi:tRNA (guanine-N7-)-methyltransferase